MTAKIKPVDSNFVNLNLNDIKVPEESKVGKWLSDLTTRRVIILVLAMMFSVPLFTLGTYITEHKSYEFGL